MSKTLHDRYTAALKAKGYKLDINPRGGDTRFLHSESEGAKTYYYVGTHGALRFGRNIATSRPCSDKFKKKLLEGF